VFFLRLKKPKQGGETSSIFPKANAKLSNSQLSSFK